MMLLKNCKWSVCHWYAVDTRGFDLKDQCNTDKSSLKIKIDDAFKKVSNTGRLFKKQIIMLISLRLN